METQETWNGHMKKLVSFGLFLSLCWSRAAVFILSIVFEVDNAEVNPQTIMLVVVVICNAYIDRLSVTDDNVEWERRNEKGRKRIMIVFVIYYVVTTESLLNICLECKYQNIRPDKIKNSNETNKQNARP